MADQTPSFDPSAAFSVDGQETPTFDLSKAYDTVSEGSAPPRTLGGNPMNDLYFSDEFNRETRVLNAFGQGAKDGWGSGADLGAETEKILRENGIFNDYQDGHYSLSKAFNEALIRPLATAGEAAYRAGAAGFGAVQGAAHQIIEELPDFKGIQGVIGGRESLANDIAGVAEAFPLGGAEIGLVPHVPDQLPPSITKAQEMRVIGPGGEAAYMGTQTAEQKAALAKATTTSREVVAHDVESENAATGQAQPTQPNVTQAAPDIHEMARQINPTVVDQFRDLDARHETFTRWIDELATTRDTNATAEIDKQIADTQDRLQDAAGKRAATYRNRLEDLQKQRDDALTEAKQAYSPDMQRIQKALIANDERMRDLAPEYSAAYQQAREAMPEQAAAAPETAPSPEGIASEVPPAPEQASSANSETPAASATDQPSEAAPASPKPLSEQTAAISSDVSQKLMAAGRPKEEADAAAQIIAARYATRAARFNGAKGSAEDLYKAEGAGIRVAREREPSRELAQKDSDELSQPASDLKIKEDGTFEYPIAESGSIGGRIQSDGKTYKISISANPDRGRGAGTKAYAKMAADIIDRGGILESDRTVTAPAARVYEKLKTQGFAVEKNPYATKGEGGAWLGSPGPDDKSGWVYRVTKSPRELEQPTRGKVRFDPDGQAMVTLFKKADPSTFMHESGHVFLEEMMRDAADERAPQMLRDDMATVQEWLGTRAPKPAPGMIRYYHGTTYENAEGFEGKTFITPQETYARDYRGGSNNVLYVDLPKSDAIRRGLYDEINEVPINGSIDDGAKSLKPLETKDISTRQHEKFARGFERYLMEGVAPSKELASVFGQFKDWLTQIYRSVTALKSEITPQIREVFDRLLAENPERQPIIAPNREAAHDFSAAHEKLAEETAPEHAASVADQVRSESDDMARLFAPDIHKELNPDEPIGEAGANPEANPNPASGGAPTGANPGDNGTAAAPGNLGTGGSETAPEGAGARGSTKVESPTGSNERFAPVDGHLVDKAGNIRLDNMEAPEDVKAALRAIADRNDDFLAERGGVISDQSVMDMAESSGLSYDDIKAFAKTMRMGPVVIKAAEKMFIDASAEAHAAADMFRQMPSEANEMAAIKAWGRMEMIQGTFSRLTADPGRMMRALRKSDEWRNAGISPEHAITEITERTPEQWRELFQSAATMKTPAQMAKYISDMNNPTMRDKIQFVALNGLISGPVTHMTYEVATAITAMEEALLERPIAAALGSLREAVGGEALPDRVQWAEVMPGLIGAVKGSRDGLRAALQAFKTNVTTALPGEEAVTQLAGMNPINKRQPIGGAIGTAIGVPGRVVTALHSFNRNIFYAMDIQYQAARTAAGEGLTGWEQSARIAKLTASPTQDMMDGAIKYANELAYMKKPTYGSLGYKLESLANHNLATKMVVPFMRVGSNIIDRAYVQRTPIGILSKSVRDDLLGRNGGAAADLARSKMVAGSLIAGSIAGLTIAGLATGAGPVDPAKRALWLVDHQPYSVKIGNAWVPYQRLGHIGMLMGMGAGLADSLHVLSEDGAAKSVLQFAHEASKNVLDESWMAGLSNLTNMIDDPARATYYLSSLTTEFVPFSVFLRQTANAIDPYSRDAPGYGEQMQEMVPFWRESLAPKVNVWGQIVPSRDSFLMALGKGVGGSVLGTENKADPVNVTLDRLGRGMTMPERSIRSVKLTSPQYYEYAVRAGRLTKDQLDQVVRSPGFNSLNNGTQLEIIDRAIKSSRAQAEAYMMQKYQGQGDLDIMAKAISNKSTLMETGKKPN